MRALLINGSPHEAGCTFTALREVEKGLRAGGIETEILQIGRRPIRGCIDCGACAGKNRCAFSEDGVNRAIELMEQRDALVVGSPVYYAAANGALISFLNRMFFAGNCFAHKPAAAVVSARRAGTTATLDELNKYFTIAQMPVVSSRYWNMVHGNTPEEVAQDAEGLYVMRRLGENMAWLLHCIEAGRRAGIQPPQNVPMPRTNFVR